jgi:hypothetical protein
MQGIFWSVEYLPVFQERLVATMILNWKGFFQVGECLNKVLELLKLFIEDHNRDIFGSRKIFM